MPKSYWTKIQTPNGLKYFRADEVTDELLQKIKDAAGGLFLAKYQETTPAEVFAAIDLGKTVYVSLSTQGTGPFLQTSVISKDAQLSTTYARFTGIFEYDGVIREYAVECTSAGWESVTDIPLAVQSNLAPAYDSLQTYAVDDIVHRGSELYRCTTAIDTPENWTPAHWTQTTVAAELGKTFFATVFTTPYSEIKAAYDSGRSIIAVDGHAFYHMFDCNESAGHEQFRFSSVSGNVFLLWTCNKTGYDGTHGWNPQPDVVSCAHEGDIAPRYSSESTYGVGDIVYSPGGLLYRCTTAISTPETWNQNHWTRTDMATELDNTFFATIFTTPYDEIKAAYDRGDVVVGYIGGDIYPLYYHSTSQDIFRFACLHGYTWYMFTCWKGQFPATNDWNPQPGIVNMAQQVNLTDMGDYDNQRTYSVGDIVYNGGNLYRCITAITVPENWTAAHWTQTSMNVELQRVESLSKVVLFECVYSQEAQGYVYPTYEELNAARVAGKLPVIVEISPASARTYYVGTFLGANSANVRFHFVEAENGVMLKLEGPESNPVWSKVFIYDFAKSSAIAPEYDSTATYAIGDAVMHDGLRYECSTAISTAEEWDSDHWTETSVEDAIGGVDTWTEVQISSNSEAVNDFHWCKMYYNDTLKMYSLNFWCTISNISSIALGWNNLFEVDIQDAPNILNFACRSRRGDHDVWVSENVLEQIGFIKVAGKVYLRLFNSDTTSSGERLYYAPTISFPATYFSGI